MTGIDHSRDMVAAAAKLVKEHDLEARIRVMWGDVAEMPFPARSFDRVLTVNTVYYWPDLRAGLREIARVMKPGGRLAMAFRPRYSVWLLTLGWRGFHLYEPDEIARALRDTGFEQLRVKRRSGWGIGDTVIVTGSAKAVSPARPRRPLSKSRRQTS